MTDEVWSRCEEGLGGRCRLLHLRQHGRRVPQQRVGVVVLHHGPHARHSNPFARMPVGTEVRDTQDIQRGERSSRSREYGTAETHAAC